VEPRGTAGAAVLDGAIYVFGGESQARKAVLADVLRLAPGATTWTPDTPMPTPRNYARAVTLNGIVYTVGGSVSAGSSHASAGSRTVESFRPGR
jgi:N-acetylneuraminic acid mutarotase